MAQETLDLRGLRYTMPLVKLAAALKRAAPGDIFEVISDYPTFEHEIRTWCTETGNVLQDITRSGADIHAVVKKKES